MNRTTLRAGAGLAIAGILITWVATSFHGGTDPANLELSLSEYAANPYWKIVHLGEFTGALSMLGSLVIALSYVRERSGSSLALLGVVAATLAASAYAANHAVDGVAIRRVAEAWVNAPPAERAVAYRLADSVRSIEQGLTSFVTLNLGITVLLSGAAIATSRVFPPWFGWTALLVGSSYVGTGISFYYLGFSQHIWGFWSGVMLSVWLVAAAFVLWREGSRSQLAGTIA